VNDSKIPSLGFDDIEIRALSSDIVQSGLYIE
jgi:hypothetical protein